ncbi:MAG TPA: hypothetical protein DCF68_10975 [Cyanothece sp. UBA12306]|nr:hypothetical protein [Cyanothece sp. UBA12306]
MNRQSIIVLIGLLFTLFLSLTLPEIAYSGETLSVQGMGRGGMRGGRMMGGDGRIIHQLFANHDQIRRTVEEIPGGVRTVTESDNPQVAALIKEHVPRMYQRIENGQGIPMIMMSSTLPTMAQNPDLYHRQFEMTSKGIMVTETSNDPDMVAVIREHAREVTGFVKVGMPGMMDGMMR